jgi:hypothetical protein
MCQADVRGMKSFTVTATGLDSSWMVDAACRGRTDLFFPRAGGIVSAEVKSTCAGCPVVQECGDYARALPEPPEGVWAGVMRRRP